MWNINFENARSKRYALMKDQNKASDETLNRPHAVKDALNKSSLRIRSDDSIEKYQNSMQRSKNDYETFRVQRLYLTYHLSLDL